jgi:hypothetical protein
MNDETLISSSNSSSYPSLELVYREARALYDRQSEQIDALDTKASIIVGFCGVVLAALFGGLETFTSDSISQYTLIAIGLATL